MTTLAAVCGVPAPHRYPQPEITEAFVRLCLPDGPVRSAAQRVQGNAGVSFRNLALPLDEYPRLDGFAAANDVFLRVGTDLAAQAVSTALAQAGIAPQEVDLIVSTTVTGIAVPSLDARIAARVGLAPQVRRLPMFGLGCVAGAAGIARLHDYLVGHPDAVAVLVAVELCSLTVQRGDRSMANMVAAGLFGDGAAAVVAVGANRAAAGPRVLDSVAHLYPDTERTMGWDLTAGGLQIVLGAEVPELVARELPADVTGLLDRHGLSVADISTWVAHPGGPKVIGAMEAALGTPPGAFDRTRESLAAIGNLSSASVLHVLADTIAARPPAGSPGVLLAMGPGFCSELVLLRW